MAEPEGGSFNHVLMRERMAALGKSTADVASACGVSDRTARKWRDGHTAPRFTKGMRLAEVLGVEPAALLFTPTGERARGH